MSLPYFTYRRATNTITGKTVANIYISIDANHSVSTLWKSSFYIFICLWLLFGGLLELGSTSYLATNIANSSWESGGSASTSPNYDTNSGTVNNSAVITQLPSSPTNKADSGSNVPATNTYPQPNPSSPESTAVANLISNDKSSVNSATFFSSLQACQTKINSTLNIAKANGLNGEDGLFGGVTNNILGKFSKTLDVQATTAVCNYSYYSIPNLISYQYSDNTFSQLLNIENEGSYGYYRPIISPTIYAGQVFFKNLAFIHIK